MENKKTILLDDFIMELSTVSNALHTNYVEMVSKNQTNSTLLAAILLLDRLVEDAQEADVWVN